MSKDYDSLRHDLLRFFKDRFTDPQACESWAYCEFVLQAMDDIIPPVLSGADMDQLSRYWFDTCAADALRTACKTTKEEER